MTINQHTVRAWLLVQALYIFPFLARFQESSEISPKGRYVLRTPHLVQ